ncbi:hypothetical protein M1I95_16445 [Rossellomorea marisflavi]|uniref:hypothetical protein n=1 Tax=Rossellomorea marisflavi TaxID=189381 RepID=UPI0027AA1006|nr:hypothetical protein [Rossellomorea marisflavi]UTE71840.1 hypothetical protein M1I95_16445 [Rossellomorea marisflavi]
MTKKVKWTLISTVTLSLLTFGGLVADHTQEVNGASAEGSFDDGGRSGDQSMIHEREDGGEFNFDHDEDEGDAFFQAPSEGFSQDHGSSGVSKR